MKRIRSNHNNLLNYFIHDKRDLSPAYVRSCENFFKEISLKRQASSTKHPWECQTGAKLRKVKGTPCYGCYALKGNYLRYPAIKKAQYYRLASLKHDSWVTAMVAQVKRQKWFRWHDAGDVQSCEHMNKILEVCRQTPGTQHWLPTQERAYLPDSEAVPENLVIRLSGSKVDGPAPTAWSHTSSVVTKNATCPAPSQGGKCRECRACWTKSISNVSYGKH